MSEDFELRKLILEFFQSYQTYSSQEMCEKLSAMIGNRITCALCGSKGVSPSRSGGAGALIGCLKDVGWHLEFYREDERTDICVDCAQAIEKAIFPVVSGRWGGKK